MQQRQTFQFELHDFYGQLLCLIINVPESKDGQIQPQILVYVPIKSVKLINPTADGIRFKYYEDFGPMEFVDLNQVKCVCVIGQIMDCRRWAIVDHSTSSALIHATI